MSEVLVQALIGFQRSANGDDVLIYTAGEVYSFPAKKVSAYIKAGRIKRVEVEEEPKKTRKTKSQKKKETLDVNIEEGL